jgi:geranylgeranyl reductase family protein
VNESREVVVVGGGPAGCATAIFLKERGHDVLLIDAARFPRDKICGESVSPEAWRLLRAMGAAERVCASSPHPVQGMRLTSPDGTSFVGEYGEDREPGFALRRFDLDLALLDTARARGVDVAEDTRATELRIESGIVTAVSISRRGGPETVCEARLVVAADGRGSLAARRLGLLHEHPRLRKFAVRGHFEDVEGLSDYGEMHVGGGGYCGIAPLSRSAANVAFVLDRREMAKAGGDVEAFYRATLGRWPRISERLARARLLAPPRAIGPLALEARGVSAPGALLVGDAAGFYDPFTGEGVTLALRSAEMAAGVASRALRAGTRDLTEYDRLRVAATRHKFRLNRLLQFVVEWPGLSNAVAARLARRPDLADQLVGIAGDFIPARTALGPRFLWSLLASRTKSGPT